MSGTQRLSPGENFRLETQAGVRFLWIRTAKYKGNGSARVRNMLEYAWRAWCRAATQALPHPDVIIGSTVHPLAAVTGALLAKRFGVPFVLEVRDLWPQTLIDLGRIPDRGLTACAMRAMERWLYQRADRILTLLPRAVDYIAPLGVPKSNVVWIPNGVEISAFPDPGPPHVCRGRPFTLMYLGSHGQANGLDNVLMAMKLLQDRKGIARVRLRMIGDGPAKPRLRALAKQLGLQNVAFEPPTRKSDLAQMAAQADAFVAAVLDRPKLYRFGISMNKLYDYLAARRPIVMASAAINDPIQDAGAGLTVPPEDPEALAGAISKLIAMPPSVRDAMGEAGRRYVEQNNDFRVLAKKLAEVLNDCVDRHTDSSHEVH